jgi:hypothetical protein
MTEKEIKIDKSHILLARKKTQQEHHTNYRHNNNNIPSIFAYNQADDGREIHSLTFVKLQERCSSFSCSNIHLARTKHTRSNMEERNVMLALPNSHCNLCRKRAI